MNAGRELDALVAREVMGLNDAKVVGTMGAVYDFTGTQEMPKKQVPNYSTSIEAAWEVVEKLRGINPGLLLDIMSNGPAPEEWEVTLEWFDIESGLSTHHYANGDTAPHAICLAALKAVGYSLKE